MDWIIQQLVRNDTIVAAALTFLLSVLGAKKVIGDKLNRLFVIVKELLELVMVLSKTLKPEEDGRVRVEKQELLEIQKEVTDLKKALGGIVALK